MAIFSLESERLRPLRLVIKNNLPYHYRLPAETGRSRAECYFLKNWGFAFVSRLLRRLADADRPNVSGSIHEGALLSSL